MTEHVNLPYPTDAILNYLRVGDGSLIGHLFVSQSGIVRPSFEEPGDASDADVVAEAKRRLDEENEEPHEYAGPIDQKEAQRRADHMRHANRLADIAYLRASKNLI